MRTTPLQPWIAGQVGATADGFRAAVERYQLARVRETVARVRERSRFYRDLLAGAPASPEDLTGLAAYPFTTAADLAAAGPRLLCVCQDDVARVVTLDTSGTTGPPKRLYFTREDQELTIDFFRVGMSTFTGPGDRVLILLPCERPRGVGDLLATALERLGAVPVRHSVVRDVPATVAALHREPADVIVGIPVQVLALARHDRALRPREVLLSTDHVPRAITAAVEDAWGCRVFGHYGLTEMGLGGGVECEARRGYHLREADLYVEVVDPVTGEALPPGAEGEVVFTTLTRVGMPLLRYRTGDISRFVPGPCPCGTTLRTLERVTHRAEGVVRLDVSGSADREPRTATDGSVAFTRADLDEALFPIGDVLDVDVTVGGTAVQVTLEITVTVKDGTDGTAEPRLRAALTAIPAIERARSAGRLDVTLAVKPVTGGAPGPAKRRIRDVRDHA